MALKTMVCKTRCDCAGGPLLLQIPGLVAAGGPGAGGVRPTTLGHSALRPAKRQALGRPVGRPVESEGDERPARTGGQQILALAGAGSCTEQAAMPPEFLPRMEPLLPAGGGQYIAFQRELMQRSGRQHSAFKAAASSAYGSAYGSACGSAYGSVGAAAPK